MFFIIITVVLILQGQAHVATRRSVLQLLIRGMLRVHSEQLSGWFKWPVQGFPGGSVVKTPSASAGDAGSIPGLGRALMLRNK